MEVCDSELALSRFVQSGRFSPLRYPGGKGKLARFMKSLIVSNKLSDGRYLEPYAGGAAIALELLLTGIVRRIVINDISYPIYCFWKSVVERADDFCELVHETPLNIDEWNRQRAVFNGNCSDQIKLGFSLFFLNRTNRSGIINGGVIGGKDQAGEWKLDARFNRSDLIKRIQIIHKMKSFIFVENLDAIEFIKKYQSNSTNKDIFYIDPPYFNKGRYLYYDSYKPSDHNILSEYIQTNLEANHVISYDDVAEIRGLYSRMQWLSYNLNYSARNYCLGREIMFFDRSLKVPELPPPLIEIDRGQAQLTAPAAP